MKKLKKFTLRLVAGANLATILAMAAVGYSDRVDPVAHPFVGSVGLVYPVLLAANFAFLVFWALVSVRRTLLPLAGFLVCYGPTRTYCPLNIPREVPDSGCVKVLTYNIFNLDTWTHPDSCCRVAHYIRWADPDIVCLQEIGMDSCKQIVFFRYLKDLYRYSDTATIVRQGDGVGIWSRYPIVGKERIRFRSCGNIAAAFHVRIGSDTVAVVVNHLETTGLSLQDRRNFRDMVHGEVPARQMGGESRHLFRQLGAATALRAPQADSVAAYVSRWRPRSAIVCGDLNDSPISYVHRTVGRGLTDCYAAAGNGPGITYHYSCLYVRIDNIFCTDDWEPLSCRIDNFFDASDHYPEVCVLRKRTRR